MHEIWKKLFLAAILVGPIAGFGVVMYRINEQNRARSAQRTADVNRQIGLDCDPWKDDVVAFAKCVNAWHAWQRCRLKLDDDSGVVCTHPKFQFEERLQRQLDEAMKAIDAEPQSGANSDQR